MWKKQCKRITAVLLALIIFGIMPTAIYAQPMDTMSEEQREQLQKDYETENAYALRSAYSRELMAEQARLAREQYAEGVVTGSIGQQIVAYAMSFVGVTPYVWAGGSLWTGTDCSGFVHLIYETFGYNLPTGSDAYQWGVGYHVSYEELKPGDIVVYDNGAHVAIYAGEDYVVHCSSPENGTVCWNMWYRNITAFVRVLP